MSAELRIADYQDFIAASHEYRHGAFIFEDSGDVAVRELEDQEDRLESMNESWIDSMAESY